MTVHALYSTEYAMLEKELEKELPHSICVFNHFKLLRKGLLTDKAVLVDSWPDFSTVVIVDSKKKDTLPFAVCFCKQPDSCQSLEILLRHASKVLVSPIAIVDGEFGCLILGCTTDVIDALVKSYKDTEACIVQEPNRVLVFTLPPEKMVPLEIPDGFKVSVLNQSTFHIENVCKSWDLKGEYHKYGDLSCWIKYHISNFETVCIETEDGRPVAWQLQQEYGGIGMLYVEPEYRRAKLGSIVTRTLARKLVEDGELVFACIEDNNETSITFHKKNGYVLLPFELSFAWYNF